MLGEVVLFGTGGFLVACAVLFLLIAWPQARDEDGAAPALVLFFLGLAALVLGTDLVKHLTVTKVVILVPTYFAIGFGWFIWKWRAQIVSELGKQREAHGKHLGTGGTKTWVEFSNPPKASQHKDEIAGWIILWPWGMSWTVLRWPWRLAVMIAGWARGIADRMVAKIWGV